MITWFRNVSLNIKLVVSLSICGLIVMIAAIALVGSSFNQLALASGQQDLQTEIDFMEARINEVATNLLFAANRLSNDPSLIQAVIDGNEHQLETIILTTIGLTNATDVDIVDAEGESLLGEEEDEGVSEVESDIISLALLGSEFTRIVYDEDEAEESPLRLTVAVPIILGTGEQVGALLVGQEMNDDFLNFVNYERDSDHLLLSYEGETLALTQPEDGRYDIRTIPTLFDAVSQAQKGVNYVDSKITYTANGYAQILGHMPITVDGRLTNAVMSIVVDMNSLFTLRDTIVQGLLASMGLVIVFLIFVLLYVFHQFVVAPLGRIQVAAQSIMGGNYDQRIEGLSRDEVGKLGVAFNSMTAAVQSRESQLSELNQTLEQRVAERTADMKKARDEALAAQRIANENSRLKSEFLSMMSHELRTPMNAIEGFTSIMLNRMAGVEFNAKTERYLGKIQSNSHRLLGLINDFLDLSRIESGRLELAYSPMSPIDMVQGWKDNLSSLAEKKALNFEVTVDPNLPQTLYGDEESLSKIVINLLGNAIKFTETGTVSLKLEKQDNLMIMEVRDTGIGIPPHAREYIFDEFRQVDMSSKRQHGGTGLGLSIVQKLANAMGGTVTLQSEVGVGSIFTVAIPIQTEPMPI